MTWVHTFLAIWLTLAVPAAGVAAVSQAPDCRDHASAPAHEGHGDQAGHGADTAPQQAACDCDCAVVHCGTAPSVAGPGLFAVQDVARGHRLEAALTPGVTSIPPENPFRPPTPL